MRERIREWLLAAFRRAPIGLVQSAGFIVAGGAVITGASIVSLPSNAPTVVWWVWWIALAFAVFLFVRGLIGALGWFAERGWIVGSQVQQRGLPRIRVEWPNLRTYPPTVIVAPRDPKWEQGDQLMFEGLALLDAIRQGGDRTQQATEWLTDVREFLRVNNPQAWAALDAPTGLLPFRSSGYPREMVEMATTIDGALFLIRRTNPRVFARAHVAIGGPQ